MERTDEQPHQLEACATAAQVNEFTDVAPE